jgi:hypothetical protein
MSKRTPAVSVLTANRLHDGIVVFLGGDGVWVEDIDGAAVARSPEAAQELQAQGTRASARNLVVEPYLAEVRETGGRLLPVRQRERVRIDGPSILGDVPGYAAPAARAASPSLRATPPSPSALGEGRGEGQRHTPTPEFVAAPHPSLSPQAGRGDLAQAGSAEAA